MTLIGGLKPVSRICKPHTYAIFKGENKIEQNTPYLGHVEYAHNNRKRAPKHKSLWKTTTSQVCGKRPRIERNILIVRGK